MNIKLITIILFFSINTINSFSQKNINVEFAPISAQIFNNNYKDKGEKYYPIKFERKIGYYANINFSNLISEKYYYEVGINYKKINSNYQLKFIDFKDEYTGDLRFNSYNDINLYSSTNYLGLNGKFGLKYNKITFGLGFEINPFYNILSKSNFDNNEQHDLLFFNGNLSAHVQMLNKINKNSVLLNRLFVETFIKYSISNKVCIFSNIQVNPFKKTEIINFSIKGYTLMPNYNDPNIIYNLNDVHISSKYLLITLGMSYSIFKNKKNTLY